MLLNGRSSGIAEDRAMADPLLPNNIMMLGSNNSITFDLSVSATPFDFSGSIMPGISGMPGNGNHLSILETALDNDGIFTTLHGYQVTLGALMVDIIMVILAVWIILLNCLLIHTLIKCHAQLEVTDMFIHSLAMTDATLGVLVLYNSTYNIANFQNRYECLARFGLIHAMLMNSTGHVLLLTINRYIKIIQPFRYLRIFKKWRTILCSVTVWCFSLIIGSLPLLGWSQEYVPQTEDESHIVCRYFGIMMPGYIIINVLLYWVPLIMMVVMYSHVCKITWRHSKEISAHERAVSRHNSNRRASSRRESSASGFDTRSWRFTKTVLIVVGIYFCCWLPTGSYFMVQLSGSIDHLSSETLGNILTFTTAMGFLNSLLNPIIYATQIPCVNRRFHRVFCCRSRSDERRMSVHSMIYSVEHIENLAKRRKASRAASLQSNQPEPICAGVN